MTNHNPNISSHITVQRLLERHPQSIRVFFKLGMHCPGCPAEAFHTLEEAALAHNRDPELLIQKLNQELSCKNQNRDNEAR
ncbi:MAG: DUF1858 domain-containing protein [Thermodesulfobacteriota bacterium]